ncbi:MAG: rod shape-determining protein [Oscillospiraceae bacterium]|nr:rod shape-determining protein [Oscillospiraceae bacterium]
MASYDIGIDLGTTKIIIYVNGKGIVLDEAAVVAYNHKTKKVLAVGKNAFSMIGRTPEYITAVSPLRDGVITDMDLTELMIKELLKKISESMMVKPRVAVCVPSTITEVERRAVVRAASFAGARKVYLIDEPIAAAIGAGINISRPDGFIVVDIGGGTTDIAVISLNGVVEKKSIKIAGNYLDETIAKYILNKHKILIGDRMAETIKCQIGNVFEPSPDKCAEARGRNMITGMPRKVTVSEQEIYTALKEPVLEIIKDVNEVLERTPPELIGDIHENGLLLTGGVALLKGLPELMKKMLNVKVIVPDDPLTCVAVGTGKAFDYLDELGDGFVHAAIRKH